MTSIKIPWESLSEDALTGVIQEFVTREGTEYGATELSLADKCDQVLGQLRKKQAEIRYDDETDTCTVFPLE